MVLVEGWPKCVAAEDAFHSVSDIRKKVNIIYYSNFFLS